MTHFQVGLLACLVASVTGFLVFLLHFGKKKLNSKCSDLKMKLETIGTALTDLENCKTLYDLLTLHKSLCVPLDLNHHIGLGPRPGGLFRTRDISTMTGDEVILGCIYGLWYHSLDYWSVCEEKMSDNVYGLDPETKK